MKILQTVDVSPLVVEWEQCYIWHGIQQGWSLLNVETIDEELVAHIMECEGVAVKMECRVYLNKKQL